MAVIKGKWKLISTSNMEAFHDAINTPAEFKAKVLAMSAAAEKDPTNHLELLEIDVSGGTIQRSILVNGQKVWGMEYKLGVEQESSGPDGRPAKGSNHLVSDSKITFVNKGSDFEISGSMEAEGNGLTLTLIGNGGVTAYQKFVRI